LALRISCAITRANRRRLFLEYHLRERELEDRRLSAVIETERLFAMRYLTKEKKCRPRSREIMQVSPALGVASTPRSGPARFRGQEARHLLERERPVQTPGARETRVATP
jgi:hypothetical protein